MQKQISEILGAMASLPEKIDGLRLGSLVSPPASEDEISRAWGGALSDELRALWRTCARASLFKDLDYGQWGLAILSPDASRLRTAGCRLERPSEFDSQDVVLGEFLGDQELLVVAPNESGDRRILIARPLDARPEWSGAGRDVQDFLRRYLAAGGDKYWEFHLGSPHLERV